MPRKPIPQDVQNRILLKSRRRCCLCFWLEGKDDVQKGQIAHLDGNNENAAEDNLAFLCFNHHDDYDGTTRLAKGLQENEVRHWRDELYKEMDYRFRTVKKHSFELTAVGCVWIGPRDEFGVRFRLKNAGENTVKRPMVSIRLVEHMTGKLPQKPRGQWNLPAMDFWGMTESREDFFEQNGRVGMVQAVGGINAVLLAGHTTTFDGLGMSLQEFPPGTEMELDYRVDAEDMVPFSGKVSLTVPSKIEDFTPDE